MHYFYFNDAIPPKYSVHEYSAKLEDSIREFNELCLKHPYLVNQVITSTLPSNLTLGNNFNLLNVIDNISNIETKKLCFSLFYRYPIEEYFNPTPYIDTLLKANYKIEIDGGLMDAINLALSSYYNSYLFTVGLHSDVTKDILYLKSDTSSSICLNNLYGNTGNTDVISRIIESKQEATGTLLDQTKSVLTDCVSSTTFDRDFQKLNALEQQSIKNSFQQAIDRKLSSKLYPDTNLIKDVRQKNCTYPIYELRVYTPTAIRVYFHESSTKVFLASIDKKSTPDQNSSIRKAHAIVTTLIKTQN